MSSIPEGPLASRALRRVGASLCGRYRLHALIGIGGMAAVYAAVHRNGHAVAIKILHDRLSADPEIERLFRREALLANKINHPGVVPVIDDDVSEDGCIFLVMPLLEGETLRARAERLGGKLPVSEVVLVAHDMLEALGAAHAQKIVHRDIKPENVFLTHKGETRVLDFGIGRFYESNDPASVTRSGRAVGTPAFMAPEQALGRLREVDGLTDLWAVGATMYTLLSGRLVHEGATGNEVLVRAATRPSPSLGNVCPEVAAEVREVVDRALSFGREARWPDATAMARALANAASSSGTPLSAIPRPLAPKPEPSDAHAEVTRPPVAAKHLREVPTHATAGASGRGTTQALRLAITRTLNLSEAAPRTRVWVALAAASAILTGGTAAVRGVARGAHARAGDAAATSPELSLRPEADAKALRRHLADAHAAILGGRPSVARNAIQDALHIDDASAEARLALVRITSLWPDDAERATFVRAQDLREALKEDDRAYLEALAPGMTVPADYRQQADRLEGLHARVRGVLPVTLALADAWLRINKSDDAIGLLKPLAESPGAPALVLAAYANALSASDETDEAMTRLEHCATDYPAATSCLEQLSQLYLLEGRCPEAERVARKELALDANSTDGYFKLAFALDGERAPPSEVRNVLDKCSEHIDLSVRAVYKARFDEELALVEGRFKDALASDTELRVATSRLSTDAEHLDYTNRSMELKAELGLQVDAREVLSEYSVARQGLQRDTYGGDNVMYLNAVAASLDLLPRKGWLSLRASRLAAHMDRDDLQDGPERTWLEYFAIPANDPGSAREAIAALPKNRPFPRRSDRWPLHDGAIGNVLSLTGKAETATQYFERASASCMRLDNPIEYSRALLRFAEHLEREHQRDRACETYARILSAWPRDSGSITAATAAARTDAFCKNATRAKTH